MQRLFYLIGVLFWLMLMPDNSVQAQIDASFPTDKEVEIAVGDSLVLGKPKSSEVFAFIDIFKKTRWDPRPLPEDDFTRKYGTFDSSTGNGFYRYFFRGDFDAAELPANFSGRKFEILGLEVLSREKDGSPMNIIYLRTAEDNTVIMVDVDRAFEYGEISEVILGSKKSTR